MNQHRSLSRILEKKREPYAVFLARPRGEAALSILYFRRLFVVSLIAASTKATDPDSTWNQDLEDPISILPRRIL